MMRPLSENTHSTGAELAGALSTHSEWHQWGIFSAGIDSSHTGGHNINVVDSMYCVNSWAGDCFSASSTSGLVNDVAILGFYDN